MEDEIENRLKGELSQRNERISKMFQGNIVEKMKYYNQKSFENKSRSGSRDSGVSNLGNEIRDMAKTGCILIDKMGKGFSSNRGKRGSLERGGQLVKNQKVVQTARPQR